MMVNRIVTQTYRDENSYKELLLSVIVALVLVALYKISHVSLFAPVSLLVFMLYDCGLCIKFGVQHDLMHFIVFPESSFSKLWHLSLYTLISYRLLLPLGIIVVSVVGGNEPILLLCIDVFLVHFLLLPIWAVVMVASRRKARVSVVFKSLAGFSLAMVIPFLSFNPKSRFYNPVISMNGYYVDNQTSITLVLLALMLVTWLVCASILKNISHTHPFISKTVVNNFNKNYWY